MHQAIEARLFYEPPPLPEDTPPDVPVEVSF